MSTAFDRRRWRSKWRLFDSSTKIESTVVQHQNPPYLTPKLKRDREAKGLDSQINFGKSFVFLRHPNHHVEENAKRPWCYWNSELQS
jgi:hypothetical protein